jgi:hypothetical protein
MNNYDMQDYMHSPDAERARIVGLFDAATRQIDDMEVQIAYQHIIEGLRK